MFKDKKQMKWTAIIVVGIVALIGFLIYEEVKPGRYDAFAQCMTQKDVVMYGAFWCPHCRENKELFGGSWRYVNYVECSTPDKMGKTPICIEKDIEGYPTWEYGQERKSGVQSLAALSEWTGCELPNLKK